MPTNNASGILPISCGITLLTFWKCLLLNYINLKFSSLFSFFIKFSSIWNHGLISLSKFSTLTLCFFSLFLLKPCQKFFFKSQVIAKNKYDIGKCEDFAWVTKEELMDYFPEQAEFLNKMIISWFCFLELLYVWFLRLLFVHKMAVVRWSHLEAQANLVLLITSGNASFQFVKLNEALQILEISELMEFGISCW